MEVNGGKPGSHLIGWIVAAGIWMLFLPAMDLATSCNDTAGVDIPCPLNELANVSCTYVKGVPKVLPGRRVGNTQFPGPVENLAVQPFRKYDSTSKCVLHLNITWNINIFARQNLQGFILNVTFLYREKHRYINRTYRLSASNWSDQEIYKTAFRHECIEPRTDESILYRIEVHSLPLSRDYLEKENVATVTYRQTVSPTSCDLPDDPYMTFNWTATMWVKQTLSKDGSNSLDVCFFFAPKEFRFKEYKMGLMNISSIDKTLRDAHIYDNGTEKRQECVKFNQICPGTYKVQLMPVTDPGSCVCRAGKSNCIDYCNPTVFEPIDMTASSCSPETATPPPPATRLPPRPDAALNTERILSVVADEMSTSNVGKLTGIVTGVLLALTTISAIVIVFYIRRCRKHKHMSFGTSKDESRVTALQKRVPVLLVYSTDNTSHRKVIRRFAAYLNTCCGCDVIYDEWSQVDIVQTNPIDWLSKQMYRVKHVVIVNSLGACLQNRGWIEQNPYVPDSSLLLPDLFVPAMRQIQSKVFLRNTAIHCFHVCFPHTEQKHFLDISCGRRYKLMDHIEDLFLNIHGLSKFSATGTTSANRINATDYCLDGKEGMSLRKAMEEACVYARENPDWFQKYFHRDTISGSGENKNHVSGGYGQSNRPSGTEYPSGNINDIMNEESGNSSIGTASDMEYFSPSVGGSCSVDLDLHRVSPDGGIGGMNYDVAFGVSSPPLFAQFTPLPPDDLDDASSMGSRSFSAKVNELNEQYDSGCHSSRQALEEGVSSGDW